MSESFDNLLLNEQDLLKKQADIEDFFNHKIIKYSFMHPNGLTLTALELPGNPLNTLVIIPGRGEIGHKYAEFLFSLQSLNWRILILFCRGQGESTRLLADINRCHIDKFEYFRADVQFLLSKLGVKEYRLMAFSLGALISLDLIVNGDHIPKKAALLAPYVYPYFPLPKLVLRTLILGLGILPLSKISYTPHGGKYKRIPFADNNHSHSEIRYNLYHDYYAAHPELTIGGPTWGFLRQAYLTQMHLIHSNFKFKIPIMSILAGADKVVSSQVAFEFFKKHANDCLGTKIISIENAYHDLLNESDKYRIQSLPQALKFLEYGEENVC